MRKNFLKKALGLFMSTALVLTAGAFSTLNANATDVLDYKNLENGNYTVNVVMKKAVDRNADSMANKGVDPVLDIEVVDGVYHGTLSFMGIAIGPNKGYLAEFSYYDDGYTYDQRGKLVGTRTNGEVLSVQMTPEGTELRDRYNENGNPYPAKVKFPIVRTAINDPDGFVPVHVLIPIMEQFGPGLGQQDMLMKVDWTSLKKVDPNNPPVGPVPPVAPNNPSTPATPGNVNQGNPVNDNKAPVTPKAEVKVVTKSPATGDSTSFAIAGLGLLAVAGLGATLYAKKKNR